VRYEHWAADVEAKLVETERRGAAEDARVGGVIACPRVGVKRRVTEVLDGVAMEALRAALGDKADLAAGRAAVLGVVIGSEDLDFLSLIDLLRPEQPPRGAFAAPPPPSPCPHFFAGSRAFEKNPAVAYAVRIKGTDRASDYSWLQQS